MTNASFKECLLHVHFEEDPNPKNAKINDEAAASISQSASKTKFITTGNSYTTTASSSSSSVLIEQGVTLLNPGRDDLEINKRSDSDLFHARMSTIGNPSMQNNKQYQRQSIQPWTEDDYLRNSISWESPEQKAYVDSLLERRTHYRNIRMFALGTLAVVLLLGWISLLFVVQWEESMGRTNEGYGKSLSQLSVVTNETSIGGTTTSSMLLSSHSMGLFFPPMMIHWVSAGLILIIPPLWMSWEGLTNEGRVEDEIRALAKRQMLLIPTPPIPTTSK